MNIFTTGSLNTIGTLLDSSGNFLDVNDDLGNALNFIITTHLAAGTYYIAVESFANLTGSYTLRAEQRSDFTDDHGDTIAMTTDIELNTSESGTINVNFEPDYFKLALNTSTDVSIFTTETDNRNMVGTLIDNVGNVLGTYGTSGGNFLINRFLTSGTYYIRVSISDTSDALRTGDYILHVYDNVLQPIGLEVEGPTELNLVRFTITMIGVTVGVAADLTVKAEGAVSLEGTQSEYSLTGGAEATQIPIEAVSIGDGTVTFTVSGDRKATDTAVVRVMVSTPTLVISEVSPLIINLAARTTEALIVGVSAVGDHNSTLTATVSDEASSVALVTPMKIANDVVADTMVIFTVEGLNEGVTTITLTASHPDYKEASTEVVVRVYLPEVGLNVQSLLQFERGATGLLTVIVSESTQATIRIESLDTGIAIVSSPEFTFMGGRDSNAEVRVYGRGVVGMTMLTITASADGYATEIATVMVEVQDRFHITAPATLDLTEGSSRTINVSLSRIPEGSGSVTVTINLQEGSELTVSPPSFTLNSTKPETVTVEVKDDMEYNGIRDETLTLTADDYATATVTVNITDDDPQPIGLNVMPTELSLVRFASTMIGVTVGVAADLTVKAEGAVSLEGTQSEYSLTGGAEATQIPIEAVSIGDGTVTFTVSGDRKATDTVVVKVTVTRPTLVISSGGVSELTISLATRTTEELSVSVSAVGGHRSTLTATVTGTTNVASVTPTRIVNVIDNTPTIFTVRGLDAGAAMLTLMAEHPFYKPAMTTVNVNVIRPVDALRFRIKAFLEGAQ